MEHYLEQIREYLHAHEQEMILFWERLVNLEGHYEEYDCLKEVAAVIAEAFAETGMTCSVLDAGEGIGPVVTGTLGSERKGLPILFSGHYDTVFKKGTFGSNPFRIENGRAYGPGVLDMKGGIVISLYVVKALNHVGFDGAPLKIVFVGDEENAHIQSNTKALFNDLVKDCAFAFNMETGCDDDRLCVGRKGNGEYVITTHGVASHPGNHFGKGRNAIAAMAHKVVKLQAMTTDPELFTVSVGTISGGTSSNIIPDRCTAKVDVRYSTLKDCQAVEQTIHDICQYSDVEGTTAEAACSLQMLPYETTDGVKALYDHVVSTAAACGLPLPGKITMGGASDAALITVAGTPVLCACGVRGSGNHTKEEYAEVKSLCDRALLLSMALINHRNFKRGKGNE